MIHLWLGNPSSPAELSIYLGDLGKAYPESAGKTSVVYEKEELLVSDMAAGFDDAMEFRSAVEARASELGRSSGYALIGAHMKKGVIPQTVSQLLYLGSFESND